MNDKQRIKWNRYQKKYAWEQRNGGNYDEWLLTQQIKKIAREKSNQHKAERVEIRLKKREQNKFRGLWTKWQRGFWKEHHSEIKSEQRRRYRLKHPEKRRNGNGGIPKEAFDKMRAEYDFTCPICGRKEPFLDQYWQHLVQDHIMPRSKGGKKRSKNNIQPLCWECNTKKGDKILV